MQESQNNKLTFYLNSQGQVCFDNVNYQQMSYLFYHCRGNHDVWCTNLETYGWLIIKALKEKNYKEVVNRAKTFSMMPMEFYEYSFVAKINRDKIKAITISKPYDITIYDCSAWCQEHPLMDERFSEEEWKILNNIEHNKSNTSPATQNFTVIQNFTKKLDNKDPLNLRPLLCNAGDHYTGGYITGKPCFYEHAYHYDYSSFYPSLLVSLDYLPNLSEAKGPIKVTNFNFKNFMYVEEDGYIIFNESNNPVYIIPLNIRNPFKNFITGLYEQKKVLPKDSAERYIIKLRLNSLIGLFTISRPVKYYYTSTGQYNGYTTTRRKDWSEWFCYITALGRNKFNELMNEYPDVNFLQINTDGFFTDKPIQCDTSEFLGSLRLEYEAHNLYIYAGNQYACDEEICIAGLPKQLYEVGKIHYKWKVPIIDKDHNFIITDRQFALGAMNY